MHSQAAAEPPQPPSQQTDQSPRAEDTAKLHLGGKPPVHRHVDPLAQDPRAVQLPQAHAHHDAHFNTAPRVAGDSPVHLLQLARLQQAGHVQAAGPRVPDGDVSVQVVAAQVVEAVGALQLNAEWVLVGTAAQWDEVFGPAQLCVREVLGQGLELEL